MRPESWGDQWCWSWSAGSWHNQQDRRRNRLPLFHRFLPGAIVFDSFVIFSIWCWAELSISIILTPRWCYKRLKRWTRRPVTRRPSRCCHPNMPPNASWERTIVPWTVIFTYCAGVQQRQGGMHSSWRAQVCAGQPSKQCSCSKTLQQL